MGFVPFKIVIASGALIFAHGAAAQTCTAGPYTVYFGAQQEKVTPKAAAILDNAAAAYAGCGDVQVMLAGHTDRSGSDEANVGLSQRRAANVRLYLAALKIPDGVITTQAFGESRPMVTTKDGMKEPRNNRVEISFGPGAGW